MRLAIVYVVSALVAYADVPRGWLLTGSKPDEYETGIDTGENYQGHNSAFLKSRQMRVDGFGTLMQSVSAEQYKGKKVRLSALVKSEEVIGWSGLWMRIDKGAEPIAFDNMGIKLGNHQ